MIEQTLQDAVDKIQEIGAVAFLKDDTYTIWTLSEMDKEEQINQVILDAVHALREAGITAYVGGHSSKCYRNANRIEGEYIIKVVYDEQDRDNTD